MRNELKARIAQINAGTAPAGYKKTKVGIVPEEWEICHFKKQFARLRRKNTEGNTNVLTISAQYGLINQEEFFKKEVASEDKSNYYLLYRGDFAYNKSYSNGYPFGAFKMLDRYDSGVVSPLYICFTPTESNDCPAFYVQYFENGMMNREIQAVAQEGARNHGLLNISIDDFFNSYLLCPPLPEQQKIAEILTAQDAVIALMQKQIELLQKQKKAFLQKMFPKKGCNVPEIRFDGFTDAWEQRKLHEIVSDISTGKSVNSDDTAWDKESICILKTSCVSYDLFDVNECKKVIPEECDYVKCPVEANTIIVSRMNTPDRVGACGYVSQSQPNLFLPDRLWKLRMKEAINTYLVYVLLTSDSYKTKMRGIASGTSGSMHNIPKDKFLEIDILLPSSFEEQQIISAFFDSLNNLITLHQRKLEIEQQKKKALMQLLLTGKVRVKT